MTHSNAACRPFHGPVGLEGCQGDDWGGHDRSDPACVFRSAPAHRGDRPDAGGVACDGSQVGAHAVGANREAAPCRDPPPIRLAGFRRGAAFQPGLGRTETQPFGQGRQDARARSRRGTSAARCDRHRHAGRASRPRPGRSHGLQLRACRRGHWHEGRGRVHAEPPAMGTAQRERRQRHEMPCDHNVETYLHAYIDSCGLPSDPKGPLFPTTGRGTPSSARPPWPSRRPTA